MINNETTNVLPLSLWIGIQAAYSDASVHSGHENRSDFQ